MGKSKYPNKLDTSIEIPAVRDNIVEVGSDVLNSLRSAIFNIERTLGINPQGSVGNSVASRINASLDGNGNILKDALNKSGILSGPISNNDVSKTAGIDESKLRLEYPTTLLQDEISQIILRITNITNTLEELSYLFASHTHSESKNRHKAHAITVDQIESTPSSLGIISAEMQTSQELFEALFSSHINYDGSDISESNRSHKASQIHFDNEDVSSYVDSNDVQGAIEDVLRETSGQLESHQNLHHSNGMLRTSITLGAEEHGLGTLLVEEVGVSFFKYSSEESSRLTTINFPEPPEPLPQPISKSDILRLYNGTDGTTSDYQIFSATYNVDNRLESVQVFGMISRDSTVADKVKIFSNINTESSPAGLLISARPFPDATNLDILQVANPDASSILTKGIRPSELSINNRYITVVVDENKEISVDLYDGTVVGGQTVDTIVNALNESFADSAASVLAYRVDYDDIHSSEVALVHSMPASDTNNSFTLSIKKGADDAIYSVGLGHVENEVISKGYGSSYYIQGEGYTGLGKKLEQTGLTLSESSSVVTSHSVGIDFTEYGIIDGDLLIITNTSKDDGTYVIEDVSSSSITVDKDQLDGGVWSGSSSENSIFYIYKNSLSLKSYNFLEEHGTGNSAVFDVFVSKNRELFYNVRLEHGIVTFGGSESLISPCNFTGEVSSYTSSSPGSLTAILNPDDTIDLSLDGGLPVEISSVKTSYITLESGLHDISLLLYIEDSSYIASKITTELGGSPIEIEIYGYEGVNEEENLMLGRVHYDSQHSRVAGAGSLIPRVFRGLQLGITSDKDLSTNALDRVYQGPIRETRSNGVTKGLLLTSSDPSFQDNNYIVNIAGGTCYVKGKRFSYSGYTNLVSDIDRTLYDKVFIAINEWGEIVFAGADSSGGAGACIAPFNSDSFCILSCLEYDGVTVDAIDLRLFVDNLDLKVLNSISVSPQNGMGHFTEFGEAIKYAKRFSDIFPKAGVPTVHLKSGTHKVVVDTGVSVGAYTSADIYQAGSYAGIWINFPVNITGEGYSTALDIMNVFSDAGEDSDDRLSPGASDHEAQIYIAGPGVSSTPNGNGGVLEEGFVSISNLRMKDCSIKILDPWTKNAIGNKLNWGVRVDNVIFDRSRKEDPDPSAAAVHLLTYDGDGLQAVGNLTISNCELLNTYAIRSDVGDSSVHRNIRLLNNTTRGGDDVNGAHQALVFNEGPGDLYDVIGTAPENNIEFRGNINAESKSMLNIMESGHPWGDRVSRNLVVGGRIGIKNSKPQHELDVSGDIRVSGASYLDGIIAEGDLEVHGAPGRIKITSNSGTLGGELIFECNRSPNQITSDQRLGIITFKGSDASDISPDIGAKIEALAATSSWGTGDDYTTHLDFRTYTDGATSTGLRTNLRLDSAGHVIAKGKFDTCQVQENSLSGSLIVTNNTTSPTSYRHLALDATTLQAKNGGTSAGYLHINKYGGDVWFGYEGSGDDVTFGRPDYLLGQFQTFSSTASITSSNLVDINALEINLDASEVEIGTNKNHLYVKPQNISSNNDGNYGGAAIQSRWGTTPWPLQLQPDGNRVYIGDAWRDEGNVLTVRNKDTSAAGTLRPTVSFENYSSQSFGQNEILMLTFQSISTDNMDEINSVGNASQGQVFISMRGSDGVAGHISSDGSGGIEMGNSAFTGSHPSVIKDCGDIKLGMIVVSTGEVWVKPSGKISTGLPKTDVSCKANDSRVFGVLRNILRDKSDIYSGYFKKHGVLDGEVGVAVNSLGEGQVLVSNINGEVSNGDYITSSEITGYGMKQDDDILHNYTVAKCTESIDWSKLGEVNHNGVKYKVALVCCTYHCG